MMYINFLNSIIFCIAIPLFYFILSIFKTLITPPTNLPKSYPVFGSFFTILKNKHRYVQWTAEIVTSTPNLTFSLYRTIGSPVLVITANAANVRHILKSNFNNYVKGDYFTTNMRDFLGDGIFNADGDTWKFQRQVSSHEFNTKSLRRFVETTVDSEISGRLIPVLKLAAAADKTHQLDFQDILQRFTFDNICRIAFGYDPAYLSPSPPPEEEEKFAAAFQKAIELSRQRFASITPYYWKIKKALNFGSEKQLKIAVDQVREFAKEIINRKKKQLLIQPAEKSPSDEDEDILSRFLVSGHSDEDFVADIVISFILAGRDTTSAALTWFFWLLSKNPKVEAEILIEVNKDKSSSELSSAYDEVKDMVYTHACLCEAMRLYPPVPVDTKAALNDDVWPDGTVVKKGMRVCYHPYAMGRVEEVWGGDWAEFRPERWLERGEEGGGAGKWKFVGRDSYTYTVFQAGPRICLGREMAFIQMKRVVAGVLRRFRVVPMVVDGVEPVYVMDFTAKMKGGFPVKIIEREGV